jgi:hypothetical protein
MSKSTSHATAELNTGRGTPMPAWTPYLALFLGDPMAGGAEVVGGSYARQPLTFAAPVARAGGGAYMLNTNTVNFPTPTATWGSPAWMAVMDASTGGAARVAYLLGGTDEDRLQQVGSTAISIAPSGVVYEEF